ncbi:MAG: NAD(P)H-dependent oxidoreductase [Prochloraceae cyanobacterium]
MISVLLFILDGGGKWYDKGVFVGKRAMLSVTIGGPETMYSETGLNGDINTILYPIDRGILRFVGFDVVPPFIVWSPARISQERRKQYLEEYKQRLLKLPLFEPIPYPNLDRFDENFQLKQ